MSIFHWWEFKDGEEGDALDSLIHNLLRDDGFDEEETDISSFILPDDPKDPLEWDDDFAITVFAREHIARKDLAEYILDSDDTSRISGDFIQLLKNRRNEALETAYPDGFQFKLRFELSPQVLRHRFCTICLSTIVLKSEERIFCGNEECNSEQPKTQEMPTKEVWEYYVGKGVPKFYLRTVDDVANEAYSAGIFHSDFFRINGVHPYESDIPEDLRHICHIFYDQVRAKIGMMGQIKKYRERGISEKNTQQILNHCGHYLINNSIISMITVEDFQSICNCDFQTAKSIFEIFSPEREEHEQKETLKRLQQQNDREESLVQIRHKLNLISDEEAERKLTEIRSRDPYAEYKKKRLEARMEAASVQISETSETAIHWAIDLGLGKITDSQLALFFFEENNRPESPDIRRAILNQVNDNLKN